MRARIDLKGAKSHTAPNGTKIRKGTPLLTGDAGLIRYYKTQPKVSVTILEDERPKHEQHSLKQKVVD